jgi:predicted phosphoadenosine phosphosulfate sulfurtransferase
VAIFKKQETIQGTSWTTKVSNTCYNAYPIYDWKASDIWKYHSVYPNRSYNKVYDKMQMAGVPIKHQRLCQPYGDTQRRGLWLYSVLEADTWSKLINRVIGANSYAIYAQETGNINGEGKISKPVGMTWEQYSKVLLKSLPRKTAEHYAARIRRFAGGWTKRGYTVMPDEADSNIENLHFAPSWRRVAKTLLRNDYWCKGLGFSQPKSDAYGRYLELKGKKRTNAKKKKWGNAA